MNQPKIIKRPSEQLENSSQLGSSNGFNRKIKLASQRPGSRDQKIKTGEIFPGFQDPLQSNPYNLQIFSLFQDENTFGSTFKAELLQLQESIIQIDRDGRIRNTDPKSEYRLQNVKKWLSQNSGITAKQLIEQKLGQQIEVQKLIEVLNQRTAEDALVKLYKLISIFECMILKVAEFEAIHLIKFDETYSSLCQYQGAEIPQLQLNRFPLTFANLLRCNDFIQVACKQNQLITEKNVVNSRQAPEELDQMIKKLTLDNQGLLKQIKQKDEQILKLNQSIIKLNEMNSMSNNSKEAEYQNLITELSQEIQKIQQNHEKQLQDLKWQNEEEIKIIKSSGQQSELQQREYAQIQKSFEEKLEKQKILNTQKLNEQQLYYEEKLAQKAKSANKSNIANIETNKEVKGPEFYDKLMDTVSQEYMKSIKSLEQDNLNLRQKVSDKQIQIDQQQTDLKQLKERLDELITINQDIYEKFQKKYMTKEDFSNSYEAALKMEFDAMKKSFEKKIQQQELTIEQMRRENCKQINEIRLKLEREQETKKLLMNKLNLYS